MKVLRFFLIVGLITVLVNGCIPPIRSITGRMPESVGDPGSGAIDIGAGYMVPIYDNAYPPMFLLEPQIVFSVHPRVNIDFNMVMYNIGVSRFSNSYLGSVGAHYMVTQKRKLKCSVGGGLMLGAVNAETGDTDGNNENTANPGSWNFAWGTFFQLDYGHRFNNNLGIYFGNNVNISFLSTPLAVYGVHSVGLQFNWSKNLYSSVEVGLAWNALPRGSGYPFSFGPAITFLGYNW